MDEGTPISGCVTSTVDCYARVEMRSSIVGVPLAGTLGRGVGLMHSGRDKSAMGTVNRPPRGTDAVKEPVATKHMRLYELLAFGCILVLLYLLIVALSPLPGLHLSSTPVAAAMPWTLIPSHLLFPAAWSAATRVLPTHDWPHLTLLGVALVALAATYAYALRKVRLQSVDSSKVMRWLLVLLIGTLVFGLLLLFQPALFSDDVFTYIFSGRILTIYHADPLNTAPFQFPGDPYLQWVVSGRSTPNIYGPLWLCIASVLVSIGNGPVATLLLFKGLALLVHLLNCVLVWAILDKIAPTRRVLGTLLYAWNPLAMLELAGSGHNEGVLLTILLLAILLYVRGKGRWAEFGVLILLGVAGSMNLIAFLVAPLLLWFIVRTERSVLPALKGACWRALVILVPAVALYLPFWRGATTFFAITSAEDMTHFAYSPVGLLIGPAHWLFGFVAQWLHFPPVMQPATAADATLRATAIFIFVLIYIHLFGKVRHATTTIAGMRYSLGADQAITLPGFDVLLVSLSSAIFWYLVLILGRFEPWYVLWVLWIVTLRQIDRRSITLLLLSYTALLIYPLLDFSHSPLLQYEPLLIFGLPLVYLLAYRKTYSRTYEGTTL
nr:hypothetical protein [Ktedonobacteraceae bacterium]